MTGAPKVGERNVTEYEPGGSFKPSTGVTCVCETRVPTTVTVACGSAVKRSTPCAATSAAEGAEADGADPPFGAAERDDTGNAGTAALGALLGAGREELTGSAEPTGVTKPEVTDADEGAATPGTASAEARAAVVGGVGGGVPRVPTQPTTPKRAATEAAIAHGKGFGGAAEGAFERGMARVAGSSVSTTDGGLDGSAEVSA
jgi:hypothetical protein